MTHAFESQRLGGPAVHLAETVFFGRRQSHVFSAVKGRERAVGKMTMAVVHRVPTSVRRNEQGVLPRTVEKRGKGVCFVVIVKSGNDVVPESAVSLKGSDVEEGVDVRGAVPENLRHELPPRPPAQICAVLLAQPLDAVQITEIAGRKHAAAVGDDIDIPARCSGD